MKGGKIDIVVFTSASIVESFFRMTRKHKMADIIPDLGIVSIGPETSRKARGYGFNIKMEAKISNNQGLFNAILQYVQKS